MLITKSILTLSALTSLVAAQGHLAVLGADGVSVGYSVNAPEIGGTKDVSAESSPNNADKVDQPTTPNQPGQTPTPVMAPTKPSGPLSIPVKKEPVSTVLPASTPVRSPAVEERPIGADPAADPAHPIGVWFINQNAVKQYISVDWARKDYEKYGKHPILDFTNTTVEPGQKTWIEGMSFLSPKFFVGVSPNHNSPEIGDHRNHDTAVEFSWKSEDGQTYYDVDIEKGFSSPVWCHGQGQGWATGQGCVTDVLAACPEKFKSYNPDSGVYDQCLGTLKADSIQFRLSQCPHTYVRSNDDWNTRTVSGSHVLICTIVSTPATSEFQAVQLAEAERKRNGGLPANAVLPRRALPHGHLKAKAFSRHA
ncbi:hypothetical protein D6D10_06485 [Aureobasidium pullulans]|uniref:Uncharacterized protein n=1 Tax=Aureobasidium pullulans TaxID=5580 RepID=A0A4S9EPK7_AURPU|nr:hypothetical protein D6D10_06485 [Aureobasidium pullulans]